MHLFKTIIQVLFIWLGLLKAVSNTPRYYTAKDGREYLIESERKYNWFEAWHYCARRDLQLVIIDTEEKNDAIMDLLRRVFGKYNNYWLGGNDELSSDRSSNRPFYWLATGKEFTFKYWTENNPDNNSEEHCVHIIHSRDDYKWNDFRCSKEMGFICEMNHYFETCNKNLKNKCDAVKQTSSSISTNFKDVEKQQLSEINNKIQSIERVAEDWKIEILKLQTSTQAAVQKLLEEQQVMVQELTEKMLKQVNDLDDQLKNSTAEINLLFNENLNEKQNHINKIC